MLTPPPATRLRLSLNGPPAVVTPDGRRTGLAAREAALLARLHLEGPTARAPLAGWLWPDGGEAKARANLRQTLRRLRQAFGALLVESQAGLALAPGVTVDDEPGRLLGPLEFDDTPELAEWLADRRAAQARDRLRRGLSVAREALAAGRLDEALATVDGVLSDDPAVEEAHRLRMEVFLARGDRAAALSAWDDCRQALRSAYGISPGSVINDLGRRILAAEAAAPSSAPAATEPPVPVALTRPAHLVGRQPALESIARAFAAGHGVVVAGPGGIGKSRLMHAAAVAMEPALVVGGRPGDEHLPGVVASRLVAAAIERFDPVLDGTTRSDIQRLLPGGGADQPARTALTSALEHRRVLASVARTMLACHARGMRLVVVDDLQFADDVSMDAIAVVIGGWLANPPERAALPMFGCRPDELRPAAARLVAMLDGSRRSLRVDLAPLDVADVRALLDELPSEDGAGARLERDALATALHGQVGGNPAFLLESLRSLWPRGLARWAAGEPLDVPPTLVESVRQRLLRLPQEALQLAQLAAVAQGDFSVGLAASAFGRAPLAMAPLFAQLEAAQVLAGTAFSHDLMADAVRRTIPAAMVEPLHALVADHLSVRAAPPASVARHRWAAGDRSGAARWFLQAAERARVRWQMAEAAGAFEAAAACLDEHTEHAGVLKAWCDAAVCWRAAGRGAEAELALGQARRHVRDDREAAEVDAAASAPAAGAEADGAAPRATAPEPSR